MRRLLVITVTVGLMTSAAPALADDLGPLFERGAAVSYEAEQLVTCSTPDGTREGVVLLRKTGGILYIAAPFDADSVVSTGGGKWIAGTGSAASITADPESVKTFGDTEYQISEARRTTFLARVANAYRLSRDGVLRAQVIIDSVTGVPVDFIAYNDDGSIYCQRRLLSFRPGEVEVSPATQPADVAGAVPVTDVNEVTFPVQLAGFTRLDAYTDQSTGTFSYYSDGLFSFAVFETVAPVMLSGEDVGVAQFGSDRYTRRFNPGQVTYVWRTRDGGMALIGDLPPDMHSEVLEGLPAPYEAGLFQRFWERLFG